MAIEDIAADDLLQLRVFCTMGSQIGMNVLHYSVSTADAGANLQVIAEAYSFGLNLLYKEILSEQARFHGVGLRRMFTGDQSAELVFRGDAGPGVVEGDALPGGVSGLITTKDLVAGPGHRGRVYLPFPPEQENTPTGKPSDNYVLQAQLIADFIRGGGTIGQVGEPGITGRFVIRDGNTLLGHTVVTSQARDSWATQKRRSDYGSANVPFPA